MRKTTSIAQNEVGNEWESSILAQDRASAVLDGSAARSPRISLQQESRRFELVQRRCGVHDRSRCEPTEMKGFGTLLKRDDLRFHALHRPIIIRPELK